MRPKRILPLAIALILLAAFLTKPSREKFNDYIRDESAMPPIIEEKNGFVFALYDVKYFSSQNLPTLNSGGESKQVAIETKKETYLALFGRFWKL